MLAFLRRIGRSLLIPIAVMPVAAVFMRLGAPDLLNLPFMAAAGAAVFDNLALLFAIGIAGGMAEDQRAEAALTAVVGFLILISTTQALLTAPPPLGAGYAADDELVLRLGNSVAVGIVAGLIGVWTYNHVYQIKLPSLLSFFSGRQLAPILNAFVVLPAALVLLILWPLAWYGVASLNAVILGWGAYGTAVYGILNRALLPFGLHNVLNTYFWFSLGQYTTAGGEVVSGDIPRFLSGDPTAGPYQVGFYPIMMFGLLGAALAMIVSAKKTERAKFFGLLGGAALVSLITGITEPLEFTFLFASPLLYAVHALLTGASMLVTNLMGLRHGFGFSAGLIDYLINFYLAERPIDLLIVGAVFFVIYFLIFYILIRLFNLKTPGRDDALAIGDWDMEGGMDATMQSRQAIPARSRMTSARMPTFHDPAVAESAGLIIKALGGAGNIIDAHETAMTRIRVVAADPQLVDQEGLRVAGASGIMEMGNVFHILLGMQARAYNEEMQLLLAKERAGEL
ncbi:MAG: PTS transporter subunit EIIC [Candidatus Promineifilaceae bacterium]|jgi:PTS system N-acetylglucosamine-specific IIC component